MSIVKLRFTLGRFGQITARALSFDIPPSFVLDFLLRHLNATPVRGRSDALTIKFNLLSRELEPLLLTLINNSDPTRQA